MIRSFADKETESLFRCGKSRRFPPSNHLEALKGERVGQWSLRINAQWRLCFRFEASDAFDVTIIDYH